MKNWIKNLGAMLMISTPMALGATVDRTTNLLTSVIESGSTNQPLSLEVDVANLESLCGPAQNKPELGLQLVKKALKKKPSDAQLLLIQGNCELGLAEYDPAHSSFVRALASILKEAGQNLPEKDEKLTSGQLLAQYFKKLMVSSKKREVLKPIFANVQSVMIVRALSQVAVIEFRQIGSETGLGIAEAAVDIFEKIYIEIPDALSFIRARDSCLIGFQCAKFVTEKGDHRALEKVAKFVDQYARSTTQWEKNFKEKNPNVPLISLEGDI